MGSVSRANADAGVPGPVFDVVQYRANARSVHWRLEPRSAHPLVAIGTGGGPMTVQARDGVLGLFSGCVASGGIQASGRLAWQAISAAPEAFGPHFQLCYGDDGPVGAPEPPDAFHTTSRRRAGLAALAMRRRFRLVLVWHMD